MGPLLTAWSARWTPKQWMIRFLRNISSLQSTNIPTQTPCYLISACAFPCTWQVSSWRNLSKKPKTMVSIFQTTRPRLDHRHETYLFFLKSLENWPYSGIFRMSSQSFSKHQPRSWPLVSNVQRALNLVLPEGYPMTLKIRSSCSWWYGLFVLMSSCLQWKMGS